MKDKLELGIGSRIRNEELGVGIVIQTKQTEVLVSFVHYGLDWVSLAEIEKDYQILEAVPTPKDLVSLSQIEETVRELFGDIMSEATDVELGGKWTGGKFILQPANPELKSYEMPIEAFFHKIVMVRDRLRVMEQRINSSNLDDEEKVNLQQYITKIYGSLTSFNVLFGARDGGFKGSGKGE